MNLLKPNKKIAGILAMLLFAAVLSGNVYMAQAAPGDAAADVLKELSGLAKERDIMALPYLSEECDVHGEPSEDSPVTGSVLSGQTVLIQDASYNAREERLWLLIAFPDGSAAQDGYRKGYIEREQLACSDERFLKWERAFLRAAGIQAVPGAGLYATGRDGVPADIAQFPESYHAGLSALKQKHPQWIFVPLNTGLDWNTVITEELKGGKSLVHKSFPDYTKNGAYDDGNWFYATREILEYYMDPRNGFAEDRIFQFELLTYNETYHTEAAVERFLQNTFMKSPGKAPGTVMTFAHIFWAIGAEEGREVSPFHLAARVYQEQGQGTSGLISGVYPGYEGYYNYFNVGASGTSTKEVIENGLKYAKAKGWNNAYYSILGGADTISANYIKKGQDTLYLQKYNVNPKSSHALYTHQYMQNISAPTTEGASIKRLYASADSLDNSFVFKVPVYTNMPAAACPYPSPDEVRLQIPAGYDPTVWIDGVPYASEARNDAWIVKPADTKAKSAVVYRYDSRGIPTGMYVWTLAYKNGAYTATALPQFENLLSYHGFSIRLADEPGMRVKTGISADLKNALTGGGVDGYTLKECGTLMTDNANLQERPLVRGGKGVLGGIAYGANSMGVKLDLVYETVDARQRFTAVLVGMSASQYNTVYSFRGYAVLQKSGTEYVIYGPIVSKSMAGLAGQVLADGVYEKGSAEEEYLRKILEEADADSSGREAA